jgi:hypothetical protein
MQKLESTLFLETLSEFLLMQKIHLAGTQDLKLRFALLNQFALSL